MALDYKFLRMKRILVFTTQMMKTGGIESHLKEFCLQMTKDGVEIDLVVLNSVMLAEDEIFFNKICRKVFLGRNGRSFLRLFTIIRIALKCRLVKYDSIYTNGQGNSIFFFITILGGFNRWVHHHHTSGDSTDQATWSRAYKKALNSAKTVIACSMKNALNMEVVLTRKVDSIPCFSRKIEIKEVTKLNSKIVRFGYYGRLIPEKGIDLLCRLSEESEPNMEFHIWGEGECYSEEYFKKFKRLVYHGAFNGKEELSEVIGSIDAFLLLSIHPEGLPICLLEAMSAGLPWMATDRGGIADIACDPLFTRVISSVEDFNLLKVAVQSFANDISYCKGNRELQILQYESQFSSKALINRWKQAFGILNYTLNIN
jgi:glycosyltransferase involved in cell wall biosynthesis